MRLDTESWGWFRGTSFKSTLHGRSEGRRGLHLGKLQGGFKGASRGFKKLEGGFTLKEASRGLEGASRGAFSVERGFEGV